MIGPPGPGETVCIRTAGDDDVTTLRAHEHEAVLSKELCKGDPGEEHPVGLAPSRGFTPFGLRVQFAC